MLIAYRHIFTCFFFSSGRACRGALCMLWQNSLYCVASTDLPHGEFCQFANGKVLREDTRLTSKAAKTHFFFVVHDQSSQSGGTH